MITREIIGAAIEVPLRYKGAALPIAFVADLIVANAIVVELKATEKPSPVHGRRRRAHRRRPRMTTPSSSSPLCASVPLCEVTSP